MQRLSIAYFETDLGLYQAQIVLVRVVERVLHVVCVSKRKVRSRLVSNAY